MNYDQFRTLLHEALGGAGLMPFSIRPTETIDLGCMSRRYSVIVYLSERRQTEPFAVTATVEWEWDAALAARSATTEEDVLEELLGRDGYYLVTEQPWLRVDATLHATLPGDSPLAMPDGETWRRWVAEVTGQIGPLLPTESEEYRDGLRVLSSRSEPEGEFRCGSDGQLWLTGVALPAWQGIDLPRQWDNSDREVDEEPDAQLADFAMRVRRALEEWESLLQYLHSRLAC
jgi:hypothetical protein